MRTLRLGIVTRTVCLLQAVVQLKRLQVFLQDNRDLSKRFSAELQDISSVLAANQGDKDEECVLAWSQNREMDTSIVGISIVAQQHTTWWTTLHTNF